MYDDKMYDVMNMYDDKQNVRCIDDNLCMFYDAGSTMYWWRVWLNKYLRIYNDELLINEDDEETQSIYVS